MFRPCILAILRLYCKLNKQLYNICVEYCGGNEISSVNIYYLYGQNTTIYFHTEYYVGYTTTCFGPVCAWVTLGETRVRL
jgi:hypothetical protein